MAEKNNFRGMGERCVFFSSFFFVLVVFVVAAMANKYLFVLALIIIHTTAKSYLFGATYANTVQYIQYNKYVPKKKEKKKKVANRETMKR